MNKDTIRSIIDNAIVVISAAYVGLLVMILATIPIRFIIHSTMAEEIAACICSVIGSMICLFFLCMRAGYKDNAPDSRAITIKTALCMSAGIVIYILLTVVFRYQTGAATNVAYLARIIGNIPSTVDIKKLASEHGGMMFISMIIQLLPFLPSMITGYIIGAKKRQKDRADLIRK